MTSFRRTQLAFAGLVAAGLIGALLFYSGVMAGRLDPAPTAGLATDESNHVGISLSLRKQQLSGIRTAEAVMGTLHESVRGTGVVTLDERRVVEWSSKLDGWVQDVFVSQTGQTLRQDDPLLSISSQELVTTQVQYLAALRNRDQLPPQQQADRDFAESQIDVPRLRLMNLGVPEQHLRMLEQRREIPNAVIFRAPATGVVTFKNVLKGQHVTPGDPLYRIADLSVVWVEAAFTEQQARLLTPGEAVAVRNADTSEPPLTGRVISRSPDASAETRKTAVRIEVPNPGSRLKPGLFTTVEMMMAKPGLLIPADAVIDSGRRQTVFVAEGNGYFSPRTVVTGARGEDQVLVESGLQPGEQVVTRATFLIDSESELEAALQSYSGPTHERVGPGESRITVRFGDERNPPRASATPVEAHIVDTSGEPVTDAAVDVIFYMAAMPAMNMPAMRSNLRLTHVGGGVYKGESSLPMAGRWEATVSASRAGARVATGQASFTAR